MDTNKLRQAAVALGGSITSGVPELLATAAKTIDRLRGQEKLITVEKTGQELEEIESKFPCFSHEGSPDLIVDVSLLNCSHFEELRKILSDDDKESLRRMDGLILFRMD